MAQALSPLPKLRFRSIALLTSNRAAVLTLRQPQQQSGQMHIHYIYETIRMLRRNGNVIVIMWIPASEENELKKFAKEKAQEATRSGALPQIRLPEMKSTTLKRAALGGMEEGGHGCWVNLVLPSFGWMERVCLLRVRLFLIDGRAALLRIFSCWRKVAKSAPFLDR
ncbi:uncharacterized protein PAC_19490 [Phialocephala subalpina]|uniref:Uncharacterized protein n=1 Tax=Phialocephala subalpina TaxID=576137 RepID=A0A1L7XX64_9HELO|nr:uncharacterized protein PAC_19490 [Phialocephala subalpina]